MDGNEEFLREVRQNIAGLTAEPTLKKLSNTWIRETTRYKYSYNFTWLGRPIIQFPQDILAMQEIIWRVKPDLIVETGVARGGGLVFYASLLELIGGKGQVIGVDVEIREHNRVSIENHPLSGRIRMVQGSSTDPNVAQRIYEIARGKRCVLVALDSNHTHEHVLTELRLYSQLVTKGSYLVVFDTVVEDLSPDLFPGKPWGKGNNPKTAVREFLKTNDRFVIDREIENKLLITSAPDGYLRCVRE